MDKVTFRFGMRYELSSDGQGLLKYLDSDTFYHIHSNEMTHLECMKHRALMSLKGEVQFST